MVGLDLSPIRLQRPRAMADIRMLPWALPQQRVTFEIRIHLLPQASSRWGPAPVEAVWKWSNIPIWRVTSHRWTSRAMSQHQQRLQAKRITTRRMICGICWTTRQIQGPVSAWWNLQNLMTWVSDLIRKRLLENADDILFFRIVFSIWGKRVYAVRMHYNPRGPSPCVRCPF